MLTFSFSNEALEKALREDELLRHLVPNHWMVMTALSPLGESPLAPKAEPLPPAPAQWPRCGGKDW